MATYVLILVTLATISVQFIAVYSQGISPISTTTNLTPGVQQILTLPPETPIQLLVNSIPKSFRYAIFQAHSQIYPVTLSFVYPGNQSQSTYVTSTNAGLVTLFDIGQQSASVYLQSNHKNNIKSLVKVILYNRSDPVPGGCNMEFSVPVAPYLKIAFDAFMTSLSIQRASLGVGRGEIEPSCDISYNALGYEFYAYNIRENDLEENSYFNALSLMGDVKSIRQNGQKIEPFFGMSRMMFRMTTYRRHGVVVNVVTKFRTLDDVTYSAPYVPAVTYGCYMTGDYDLCIDTFTPFEWIISIFGALFGIFLCFVGHRFFQSAMALFGFLTSSLIVYIVVVRFTNLDYAPTVALTIILGVLGGVVWLSIWWVTGSPFVAVLIPSFDLGFLMACVLFFSPLGSLAIFQNDLNFWIYIACVTLVIPVILISYAKTLHIISCAVIGSYAVVVLLNNFAGGSLAYIVINIIRRATIKDYVNVINLTPYQSYDIIFTVVWGGLTVFGVVLQLWRGRNRPPFPVTWYQQRRLQAEAAVPPPSAPEEEPLLSHNPRPGYRSTTPSSGNPSLF